MAKDLKEFLTRMNEDPAFADEVMTKGKTIAEAEKISDERNENYRLVLGRNI